MKHILIVFVGFLMAMSSCSNKADLSNASFEGEWQVTEIGNETIVPSESTPMLGFSTKDSRIFGFTGCNRLTGVYNQKDFTNGIADFSNLGATKMLCQDDKYESKFLDMLSKAKGIKVSGRKMFIIDGAGRTVLELSKK